MDLGLASCSLLVELETDLELGFPAGTFSALAVAAGTLGPGTPQLLNTETVPRGGGLGAAALRCLPGPLPIALVPLVLHKISRRGRWHIISYVIPRFSNVEIF